jgi:hypothetical protein
MSNESKITIFKRKIDALNSVSGSFCIAKWLQSTTTLYNGYTHSCHHPSAHKIDIESIKDNPSGLHNTPTKLAARADMLAGVQTRECDYCWNIENLGKDHFSDRHYKSASEGMGQWQHFDDVVKSGLGEQIAPTYFEVAFENICNFKCTYCSPDVSSRWMEEVREHGGIELANGEIHHDLRWMEAQGKIPIHHSQPNPYIDAFWKWWPTLSKTLNTFRITGGEPLLSENTWKILDSLIDDPRPDLKLSINTNMGIPQKLMRRFVEKLNALSGKIGEIVIFTSAESTGEQAEYARYGMNWELFNSNVEYFLSAVDPRIRLQFMTTVNILSASTFHLFLEMIADLRKKYGKSREFNRVGFAVNYLRWPRHMSITLLDPVQRDAFSDRVRSFIASHKDDRTVLETLYLEEIDQLERLIDFMNSVQPDVQQQASFSIFFDELDRRRGTSLLSTFPELSAVYSVSASSEK